MAILTGDVRARLAGLPDACVQCVVTSPPYFGLRDYGTGTWLGGDPACQHRNGGAPQVPDSKHPGAAASIVAGGNRGGGPVCVKCGARRQDAQIGLEATVDEYVAALTGVFREVRRVLRPDGVCFLNLGDSYANDGKRGGSSGGKHATDLHGSTGIGRGKQSTGMKPKDLLMIPARVALALQADGWWLRSQIAWTKGNPMPESTRDRPTGAWESVFMLTKAERYFWDGEAVKEASVSTTPAGNGFKREPSLIHRDENGPRGSDTPWSDLGGSRNMRNVWQINARPYKDAHFATFPVAIPERCIKAATSEWGACPTCGAPWQRIVEKGEPDREHQAACGADTTGGYAGTAQKDYATAGAQNASDVKRRILEGMRVKKTTGWAQTCRCPALQPMPCLVLDCFGGAGTTAVAATALGRDSVMIDLKADYAALMRKRIGDSAQVLDFFWGELLKDAVPCS